tara:strand:+ start:725 stop:1429 length:705 start_codon:yes stop_codon:yes gene_type:complete
MMSKKSVRKSVLYEELCKIPIAEVFGIEPSDIKTLEGNERIEGLAFPGDDPPLHQLDLSWTIENAVSETKYLADAKLHKEPVAQGYVKDLVGVLESTKYQKGMIISPVGFTEGAQRMAKANGIGLLVVPADEEALGIEAGDRENARLKLQAIVDKRPALRESFTAIHKNFGPSSSEAKIVSRPSGGAGSVPYRTTSFLSGGGGGYSNKMVGGNSSFGGGGGRSKGGGFGGSIRK